MIEKRKKAKRTIRKQGKRWCAYRGKRKIKCAKHKRDVMAKKGRRKSTKRRRRSTPSASRSAASKRGWTTRRVRTIKRIASHSSRRAQSPLPGANGQGIHSGFYPRLRYW